MDLVVHCDKLLYKLNKWIKFNTHTFFCPTLLYSEMPMQHTLFTVNIFFFTRFYKKNSVKRNWIEKENNIHCDWNLTYSDWCFSHVTFSYHPPCFWSSTGQSKWRWIQKPGTMTQASHFHKEWGLSRLLQKRKKITLVRQRDGLKRGGVCCREWKQMELCEGLKADLWWKTG